MRRGCIGVRGPYDGPIRGGPYDDPFDWRRFKRYW